MRSFTIICLMFLGFQGWGQKFVSETSYVSFYSEAPVENIKAINREATSLFDVSNGEIAFSVPIKEFEFKKSLMRKHFNENYMDSDKYPKSIFKGKIKNFQSANGTYKALAVGDLTIHGKTQKVEIEGDLVINGDKLSVQAKFPVQLKDYNIKIPKILFSNIAESVEVTIEFQYKPYAAN